MRVIQPDWMNSAVIRPHAMKAPMFGRTMLDKKVPNCCTRTLAPVRGSAVVAVEAIPVPHFRQARDARHGSMHRTLPQNGHVAKHSGTDLCPFVWLFYLAV